MVWHADNQGTITRFTTTAAYTVQAILTKKIWTKFLNSNFQHSCDIILVRHHYILQQYYTLPLCGKS